MSDVRLQHRHVVESISITTCCGNRFSASRLPSGIYQVECIDPLRDIFKEEPAEYAGVLQAMKGYPPGSVVKLLAQRFK
jgi:hypothetical protein